MVEPIRFTSNKTINLVRQLSRRKDRNIAGKFYIEGIRHVVEATQVKADLEMILYSPGLLTSEIGMQSAMNAENMDISVQELSEEVFRSFALKDNPQGLTAVAKQKWLQLNDVWGHWTA